MGILIAFVFPKAGTLEYSRPPALSGRGLVYRCAQVFGELGNATAIDLGQCAGDKTIPSVV